MELEGGGEEGERNRVRGEGRDGERKGEGRKRGYECASRDVNVSR